MDEEDYRELLYRGSINLWVEDVLSARYLSALWNDKSVAFFVGGGCEGVRAIVHDAETAEKENRYVFGLIDRDFRKSNKAGWADPNKTFRTFIPPVNEMENYLLNPSALAGARLNNLGKTPEQIEQLMFQKAESLCWWAACREVLAELKRRFREDFIPDPPIPLVGDLDWARDHICKHSWFAKLAATVGQSTLNHVSQLLNEKHAAANVWLADGTWRREFSGKEIFRDLGSRICDRTSPPRNTSPDDFARFDVDLSRQVADWQVANGAAPQDLKDLLQALKERIARLIQTSP